MDLELFKYLQSYLTEHRRELFKEIASQRTRHFTVITEDIYQLHNTSAVMRSCEIFGIQDLHVVEEKFGKRVDREIALGAQKWVDIHRHNSTLSCFEQLKSQGYRLVATTPSQDANTLSELDIREKTAFIFGTEMKGLSQEVLDQCDEKISIPMFGFTESLNVSVAAAIILQHMMDRLRKSELNWRLSEAEQMELQLAWTCKTIKSADEIIERFYSSKNL